MNQILNTHDGILRCARELIIEGGYSAFSYADIAKVVGIRKASIHHHFPTKVDLVRALVEDYREEAAQGLAELERQLPDALAQLRAYVGYWAACIVDDDAPFCVCALLAGQLPSLPEAVGVEVKAHFHFLASWLESVLARGAAQKQFALSTTPDVEADRFMAVIHGAMISARAYGDAEVFRRITETEIARLSA